LRNSSNFADPLEKFNASFVQLRDEVDEPFSLSLLLPPPPLILCSRWCLSRVPFAHDDDDDDINRARASSPKGLVLEFEEYFYPFFRKDTQKMANTRTKYVTERKRERERKYFKL